jgi:hypothetical protein
MHVLPIPYFILAFLMELLLAKATTSNFRLVE